MGDSAGFVENYVAYYSVLLTNCKISAIRVYNIYGVTRIKWGFYSCNNEVVTWCAISSVVGRQFLVNYLTAKAISLLQQSKYQKGNYYVSHKNIQLNFNSVYKVNTQSNCDLFFVLSQIWCMVPLEEIVTIIQFYLFNKSMDLSSNKLMSNGSPGLTNVKSAENLQCDTGKSFLNTLAARNFEKYEVIVQNQQMENQLKLIIWRSKTEFPIVKILFYKILQKKLLNQCSVLQLAIQNFPCNLNSLPKMPFYQLLYLLKESLIGFQRLFDRFGPFDITNKMILIGKNGKCRVWVNQNITLNFPSKRTKLTENQFLFNAANIFDEKCLKSTLSAQFFTNLKKHNRIVEAIHYVQNYIKNHRIILPNRLNSKKLLENHEENMGKINEQHFGHDTLRKVPKFITQLRDEKRLEQQKDRSPDSLMKKENKSSDSPVKKVKTAISNRDLSQKKFKTLAGKSSIKNREISIGKSDLSPKSQISIDIKKETKSFINKKSVASKVSLNSQLQKRKSSENLKLNCPISPQIRQNFVTSQKVVKTDLIKQINDELFYTKMPTKPTPKPRKHSNNDYQQVILKREFQPIRFTSKQKQKYPQSILCSQQTAATIQQHPYKKKVEFYKNELNTNKTPERFQKINEQEEPKQIFQRNGWLKTMNNLGSQNVRETIQSQHEGVDTFSEQFALAKQNLTLLGVMGKELNGSIIEHQ